MKMAKLKDLTGMTFGHLTVIERDRNHISAGGNKQVVWKCKCDCGNDTEVTSSNLLSGHTTSCGCMGSRRTIGMRSVTHNKSKDQLYSVWSGIKRRCFNPHEEGYWKYGGRGITVCDEWKYNFPSFYKWAVNGYAPGLQIERINNDGNYEPSNCRWATPKEQAYNRRNTVYLEYGGEKKNLWEWELETGIPATRIYDRIRKGWTVQRALTQPIRRRA